ncbi:Uu.00g141030.m01.CDS01 [Anthostomella pinea]|uniref:Uu.00g141030.m01.CDS01 n=1 Tax=Anthostomella pinea TaxID=933095 RepID=A0AAI8YLE6_9PEZI|nr:Uu.00g141030.m01.CDS01 [Anthostomella pinea]
MAALAKLQVIESDRPDSYRDKVVYTYKPSGEELWEKALGGKNLSFQFGLFDQAELDKGARSGPVGPSEYRHFEQQLQIAGLTGPDCPKVHRVLDLGCGWGSISRYLAERFPECQRIDAVNISQSQLEYFAARMSDDLERRVNLFLCNAQDIDMLPDPEVPYDLVIVRGMLAHCQDSVFEDVVARISERLAPTGTVIISDSFYNKLEGYESAIPDEVDRLACGHRKTLDYLLRVMAQKKLKMSDLRQLPSNAEAIHWANMVRLNVEQHFPEPRTGVVDELHVMMKNLAAILAADKFSVFSIIGRPVCPGR